VHQVLALGPLERARHESELDRRLLHSLGEVTFVEREALLAVLEHVVGPGLIVSASCRIHDETRRAVPSGRGVGILTPIPSRAKRVQRSLHPAPARRLSTPSPWPVAGGAGGCRRPRATPLPTRVPRSA